MAGAEDNFNFYIVKILTTPLKKKLFGKGWGDGRGDIDYDTLQVLGEGTALALWNDATQQEPKPPSELGIWGTDTWHPLNFLEAEDYVHLMC